MKKNSNICVKATNIEITGILKSGKSTLVNYSIFMQDEQKYKFIKDGIVSQIVWEGTKISKPSQNTLYILLECDKEDWLFRLKESKEDWLFRLNESKTEFADSIYDNKTKAFEKAFKKLKAPYKLILDTSSYTVRDCYETIIKTLKEINND